MTRDEIAALSACSRTDALIFKEIFHKMAFIAIEWEFTNERDYLDKGEAYYLGENQEIIRLPRFSEDMSAAWQIVETLCNETGCDVVSVCKRDPELLRGDWSCNFGRGAYAFANTAPLAICRAALLAVNEQ